MGWKLTDPSNHGIRVSAEGGNEKGKYSGESGILALYEVGDCFLASLSKYCMYIYIYIERERERVCVWVCVCVCVCMHGTIGTLALTGPGHSDDQMCVVKKNCYHTCMAPHARFLCVVVVCFCSSVADTFENQNCQRFSVARSMSGWSHACFAHC